MSPKKKSGQFNRDDLGDIRNDKPVVYNIRDKDDRIIYTGSAKRGRVPDRLKEHLPGGKDPVRGGKRVEIRQHNSIADAQAAEARAIKRTKPPQNKRGK